MHAAKLAHVPPRAAELHGRHHPGHHIKSPGNAPNTDGIDPSGWNYLITNCIIDTGDDNIAIKPGSSRTPGNKNFLGQNCQFLHGHGMAVGSGSAGGLEDLTVRRL